ncbi:hypothetical protein FM106_14585 [Brachybacterium faecium]|nr:hypothetical protein FM106_14585 [Brachybacterium faecium]
MITFCKCVKISVHCNFTCQLITSNTFYSFLFLNNPLLNVIILFLLGNILYSLLDMTKYQVNHGFLEVIL